MKITKLYFLITIMLLIGFLTTGCIEDQYGIIIENNNVNNVKGILKSADKESIVLHPIDSKVINMYLVKVKKIIIDGETIDVVDKYGTIKNIKTKKDEEIEIPINKINWVEASWNVDKKYKMDFENKVFNADKNKDEFVLPFYVRDPFQVGRIPKSYNDLIIGINGRNISWGRNPRGWRRFEMRAKNNQLGKKHTQVYSFFPYLKGHKIGLSDKPYVIMPKFEFVIRWE